MYNERKNNRHSDVLSTGERKKIIASLRRTHNAQLTKLLERVGGIRPSEACDISFGAWDVLFAAPAEVLRTPYMPLSKVTGVAMAQASQRVAPR